MFRFIAPCGPLLEELGMCMLSEVDSEVCGERLLKRSAPSPLLSHRSRDSRQEPQREDGDKVGRFTIAIVFESEHLSLAIQCRYLPQGPTFINQSDKRDALTAFLSLRLPIPIKELLLTHILNGCYCEERLS